MSAAIQSAEWLRLTVAALDGMRPLAERLSPKSGECVAAVLMACAAGRNPENLEIALQAVEAFARFDRKRQAPVLRMVGAKESTA